jgi:hypothetical protein
MRCTLLLASLTFSPAALSERLRVLLVDDYNDERSTTAASHASHSPTPSVPSSPPRSRPSPQAFPRRSVTAPRATPGSSRFPILAPHPIISMTTLAAPFYPQPHAVNYTKEIGDTRKRWYVVTVGYRVGVYDDWTQVKPLVDGCSGSVYKRCSFAEGVATYDLAYEQRRLRVVEVL